MSTTTAPAGSDIGQLRARRQVRALAPNEEGFPTSRLPGGIFGFTYSPGQDETPIFAAKNYHCFEIHKLQDGSQHIVGYVKPSELALIAIAAPGTEVALFPDPWRESNQLVSVDVTRIAPARRTPPREEGNRFIVVFV